MLLLYIVGECVITMEIWCIYFLLFSSDVYFQAPARTRESCFGKVDMINVREKLQSHYEMKAESINAVSKAE
jgi:hypothetical protein